MTCSECEILRKERDEARDYIKELLSKPQEATGLNSENKLPFVNPEMQSTLKSNPRTP